MTQIIIPISLLFFTLLGCAQLNPEEEFNYGQEFSASEVLDAIEQATINNSPYKSQVGDTYEYHVTQKIENRPLQITEKRLSTLTHKEVQQNDNGSEFLILTEDTEITAYSEGQQQKTSHTKRYQYPIESTFLKNFELSEQDELIRYYNLKVTRHTKKIESSTINTTQIQFDRVDWSQRKEGEKTHFTLVYSDDTPFLAANTVKCLKFQIHFATKENSEKHVTVEQCLTLMDFTFPS